MWQVVLGIPLIVLAAVIFAPIALYYFIARYVRGKWLASQVRRHWPNKVAFLAYSDNPKWAPYLKENVLAHAESVCVVINRSNAQWKQLNPLADRVISHWGGWKSHNPLAVVFPRTGQPRVFRLYEPFQQLQKGNSAALNAMIGKLLEAISRESQRVG